MIVVVVGERKSEVLGHVRASGNWGRRTTMDRKWGNPLRVMDKDY